MSQRDTSIDILRGIAIIAVVLDHAMFVYKILFLSMYQFQTFFSVTWFIFLTGYTSYSSLARYSGNVLRKSLKFYGKRLYVVAGYLLSTIFAVILLNYDHSFQGFIDAIIGFHAIAPNYFFYILFQVWLAAPLVYWLLRPTHSMHFRATTLLAITLLLAYAVKVSGGSWFWTIENLRFGGPYLPVFVLGMIAYTYLPVLPSIVKYFIIAVAVVCEGAFIYFKGSFVIVEPTPLVISISVIMLLAMKFMLSRVSNRNIPVIVLSWFGRNSFNIFLTHFFILLYTKQLVQNWWLLGFWTITSMVAGPAVWSVMKYLIGKRTLGRTDV